MSNVIWLLQKLQLLKVRLYNLNTQKGSKVSTFHILMLLSCTEDLLSSTNITVSCSATFGERKQNGLLYNHNQTFRLQLKKKAFFFFASQTNYFVWCHTQMNGNHRIEHKRMTSSQNKIIGNCINVHWHWHFYIQLPCAKEIR